MSRRGRSGFYFESMGKPSVCPFCDKPVVPDKIVYTINEQDYHPECYERLQAGLARPVREDHDDDRE